MNKLIVKPKSTIPVKEIVEEQLKDKWMAKDKLRDKIRVAESTLEYYSTQRVGEMIRGEDEPFVIQRMIGFPNIVGN